MHLNNKIRRDVAMGLAKKAVAKHGDALTKQFVDLNAEFWKGHSHDVVAELPMSRTEWTRLMQVGILSSTCSAIPMFSYIDERNLKRASYFEKYDVCFTHGKADEVRAICNIFSMPEFRGISQFVSNDRYGIFHLTFAANDPMPRITAMGMCEKESGLYISRMSAMDNLHSVCKAFIDTYIKLIGVVGAIKTDTQLLEFFPEAKEFLPPPAPKESKSLVPVEYVQKLRDSITAGVPSQLGGA